MKKVYLLWHTHINENLRNGEDVKLLGTFSSVELAKNTENRAKLLAGFKDAVNGFHIAEYEIDKQHWTEGFVTLKQIKHFNIKKLRF